MCVDARGRDLDVWNSCTHAHEVWLGGEAAGRSARYDSLKIPGFVSTTVYRMDRDPNEVYVVVAFKDKESYHANARDPKQDERFRRMRELLAEDPEWHDGEIIASKSA